MRWERSWENTEPAEMPNAQHGSSSARMDIKDGSKNLHGTFLRFYRYILQVSRPSRVANRMES